MSLVAACWLCSLAQVVVNPGGALLIEPLMPYLPAQSSAEAVQAALKGDDELRRHHEGYLAYLDAHPELTPTEEAYWDACMVAGFRGLAADIDEALQQDSAAQQVFDAWQEGLAQDPAMRRLEDALLRVFFAEPALRPAGVDAMIALLADPEAALRFLRKPTRVPPTPEALLPLVAHLRVRGPLREELYDLMVQLNDMPQAHTALFPWWKRVADPESPEAGAFKRLLDHALAFPQHYWVWRRRQVALADDPHIRDWVRYWERVTRRHAVLATGYPSFLRKLREKPELRRIASESADTGDAPAASWPPEGEPPPLAAFQRDASQAEHPKHEDFEPLAVPRPARPAKPPVPLPTLPNKPLKPSAPGKPLPPDKPGMRQPSVRYRTESP